MIYYIFYSEKNVIGRTFAYQSLKISLALGMLSKTSTTNFKLYSITSIKEPQFSFSVGCHVFLFAK